MKLVGPAENRPIAERLPFVFWSSLIHTVAAAFFCLLFSLKSIRSDHWTTVMLVTSRELPYRPCHWIDRALSLAFWFLLASPALALDEGAPVVQATTEVLGASTGTPGPTSTAPPGQPPTASEGGAPGSPPPGAGGGEKAAGAAAGNGAESSESTAKVIRRDSLKAEPTNAAELKQASLGSDGRVAFEFRNQGWPELIEWLSALSGQPIDWQELPGDRVNITTPGRYTVDEVRDLLNRHLLGRGYTLLALDGGYTIVSCSTINPALVPRVDESQLAKLGDHTFVRVLLEVDWLSAEKLATELKPMMSKNGTLTALSTTNRIEAMDAAVTLRDLSTLLGQERSTARREQLAPEFRLRYLPAQEAKSMLEQFLGIEKKKNDKPLTPQEMMQLQQMQQQQGGQPPMPEANKSTVSIVANHRQNSLIIQAPPDRVAVAMEFLKRIDVPNASVISLADVQNRVQVFRLETLDPEKLLEIVQEMNILEPTTQTRVDTENRALIVSGSAADRYIIAQLIQRLDGSGRRFEVMQLRRLDATEVAESIAFLMGQKKEDEDEGRRNRFSYFFGMDQSEEPKEKDHFRVAANARYRQVLLWANDNELSEVRNLLIKLGELPPPEGDRRTLRTIEASATPDTLQYLQRLKEQFERISPNKLQLPDASEFTDPLDEIREELQQEPPADGKQALPPAQDPKSSRASKDDVTKNLRSLLDHPVAALQDVSPSRYLTAHQVAEDEIKDSAGSPADAPEINSASEFDRRFGPAPTQPAERSDQPAAPVVIQFDQAGNLVVSSRDTAALDQLENLMLQFAPPRRPYRVFKLQYASASWVKLNLQDYYKDNKPDDSKADRFYRWYFDEDEEQDEDPAGLGKDVSLRFVDDLDTNTIVVSGADREQLKTIEELIRLWDVAPPVDRRKTRFTKLVQVRFGKAQSIADTVKDAYRDLLSSNDRAFQQQGQGGVQPTGSEQRQRTPRNRDGNDSSLVNSSTDQNSGGSDFTFRGKLSIGVDSLGNTLVVSAEGEALLELVCDMIRQLDEASKPSGDVQVRRMSGMISGQSLEAALKAFSAEASVVSPAASGAEAASPAEREATAPQP